MTKDCADCKKMKRGLAGKDRTIARLHGRLDELRFILSGRIKHYMEKRRHD